MTTQDPDSKGIATLHQAAINVTNDQIDYDRRLIEIWLRRYGTSPRTQQAYTRDIEEFLPIAAAIPLRPQVQTYRLEEANRALLELKRGPVRGAKVLLID